MLRRFFANFCHEIGCENDQTYIFRFAKYLSTFFYTYLPVNIHFQLIIITNVSILTDPAYFVPPSCHCGILTLRSRDWSANIRKLAKDHKGYGSAAIVNDTLLTSVVCKIKM